MTITSNRRKRSPRAFRRKDARNAIYTALYGVGDRHAVNKSPAFDPNRKHLNIEGVSWQGVKLTIERYWHEACFDELTANKIVSDFNHYAKGSVEITRAQLEVWE